MIYILFYTIIKTLIIIYMKAKNKLPRIHKNTKTGQRYIYYNKKRIPFKSSATDKDIQKNLTDIIKILISKRKPRKTNRKTKINENIPKTSLVGRSGPRIDNIYKIEHRLPISTPITQPLLTAPVTSPQKLLENGKINLTDNPDEIVEVILPTGSLKIKKSKAGDLLIDEKAADHIKQNIISLTKDSNQLTIHNNKLQVENNKLNNEMQQLNDDKNKIQSDLTAISKDKTLIEESKIALSTEYQKLQNEHDILNNDSTVLKDEIANLQNQNKTVSDELIDKLKEYDQQIEKNDIMQENINKLNDEYIKKNNENIKKENIYTGQINKLEKKLSKKQELFTKTLEKLKNINTKKDDLEDKVKNLNTQTDDLEDKIQDAIELEFLSEITASRLVDIYNLINKQNVNKLSETKTEVYNKLIKQSPELQKMIRHNLTQGSVNRAEVERILGIFSKFYYNLENLPVRIKPRINKQDMNLIQGNIAKEKKDKGKEKEKEEKEKVIENIKETPEKVENEEKKPMVIKQTPAVIKKKNKRGKGLYDNCLGITNTELENKMNKYSSKGFVGVYSIDDLNDIPINSKANNISFIMNTARRNEEIGHFVAVYINHNNLEYYDSLGQEPSMLFKVNIKPILKKYVGNNLLQFKINRIKYQSNTSDTCGLFSARFLIKKYKGENFKEASGFNQFNGILKSEKEIQKFKTIFKKFNFI